jgi:carbonic anhydrase
MVKSIYGWEKKPEALPFDYVRHGLQWDAKKWPVIETGKDQSPIALYRNPTTHRGFRQVEFSDQSYVHSYQKNKTQVTEDTWTGSSFQVSLDPGKDYMRTDIAQMFFKQQASHITPRGVQFHFHSPSEHTIDGKEYDLELHIVH